MTERMNTQWKASRGPSGNLLLKGDDFYISFLRDTTVLKPRWKGDDGGAGETALCKDGMFYVLNGDFRDAYERLAPEGFDACKKFYDQQAAHAESSWSGK